MEEDGTRIDCNSSQAVAVSSNIGGIRSILGSVCTCLRWTCMHFPWHASRYCLVCKVCPHRGEGCNVSEAPGWRLLHKALPLHHHHSVFSCFLVYLWSKWFAWNSASACVHQGKGVPDVNSRLMVRKLWDTLRIPIFALVDADPHGRHRLSHPLLRASHISTCLTAPGTGTSPTELVDVRTCWARRGSSSRCYFRQRALIYSVRLCHCWSFFSVAWQGTYFWG